MTLTQHDAAIVARDPDLPGLGLVLDAGRMAETLARLLPDCALERLDHSYLRYKPGTSCLAGFVAQTRVGRIDLAAKAYKPKRYGVERARALPGHLASAVGPIALALDEPAVMVRIAPYDRELPGLARLVAPESRDKLLKKLVPGVASGAWSVLRHKPGRRHIGVLALDGAAKAIVKLYAPADFEQARQGATFAAGLGGAALFGVDAQRRVIVSAWQPGRVLDQLCPAEPATMEAVAATGTALAAVHGARSCDLPSRSLAGEGRAVVNAAETAARLLPMEADRLLALGSGLRALLPMGPEQVCPLHGDFSADQVIVGSDGVRFIDWDWAAFGPRSVDLGSFVARLEADALLVGRRPPAGLIGAFVKGYTAGSGRPVAALGVWTAAGLMRLLVEPFRQRRADWPCQMRALVDRIEQHVAQARRGAAASRASSPAGRLA